MKKFDLYDANQGFFIKTVHGIADLEDNYARYNGEISIRHNGFDVTEAFLCYELEDDDAKEAKIDKLMHEVSDDFALSETDRFDEAWKAMESFAPGLEKDTEKFEASPFDALLNAYHYHMNVGERADRENDIKQAVKSTLTAYYIREIIRGRLKGE